ncbi:MAG: extracellular solute-binding protein [Pyrinomonadaceae bacterium]|nr:extracellular solute-binding protein [Pyrinomonadaceae bacterium]
MRLLFITLLLASLSNCTPSPSANTSQAEDRITLTYWSATNPDEVKFANETAAEWNREHPQIQIKIEVVPAGQSSEEVVLAAVASRTTPDIYASVFPGVMQDLLDARGVVQLDGFPDFDAVLNERMPPETSEQYRSPDGHFYQMPWKSNPIMMLYNTGMLREVGITTLPTTYSEFLAAATRVTRDRDGDGRVDQWMATIDYLPIWYKRMYDYYPLYLAASGGETLLQKRRVAFNNEHSIEVFRFLQECFSKGYVPRQTFQGDVFLDAKVAAKFSGPWSISHLERYRPADFEYEYAPMLRPDNASIQPVSYADSKSIVIFTTCRHPREAWEFVKFMTTKRNDLRLLEITSQLPIRASMLEDEVFADYFGRHPQMVRFAEQVLGARSVDSVSELKEIFDIITQEFEASVIFNLKSPEQAVQDAAQRSQTILDVE